MTGCYFCGENMLMRYPGNDPENGHARPICKNGHTLCSDCNSPIEATADVCSDCEDNYPCPFCGNKEVTKGCLGCDVPDQCWRCGEYVEEGEETEVITVDDDPGDPETGPQPNIIEVLVHKVCTTCTCEAEATAEHPDGYYVRHEKGCSLRG